jgi:V-type H+-transporting ATPase proteolipid subunit
MIDPHLLTGLGAALSMFLSAAGSCFASVPSGIFAQRAVGNIKNFFPINISGVLAIYGCIISVILSRNIQNDDMTATEGFKNLSAGLAVGLTCLASGMGMGCFVEKYMQTGEFPPAADAPSQMQEGLITPTRPGRKLEVTWNFLMVLVFIEAIGLYGLIVALFLASHQK